MPSSAVLIIEDAPVASVYIAGALRAGGYDPVITATSLHDARQALSAGAPKLIFLDLGLPDGDGEAFIAEISERHPATSVIITTSTDDVATAVRCMRSGAVDYLVKPVDVDALLASVRRALAMRELDEQNRQLPRLAAGGAPANPKAFLDTITADPEMHRLMLYAEIVAPGSQAVFITGETGTGKELMARAVHRASGRRGQFVAVNIAGLDETMFSDTLFGHRRGAFTGAAGDRAGLVQQAEGGTLFLDEIGDLNEQAQVKLLRLLQEGEYYPLGSDSPKHANARIVAATHQNPEAWAASGRLRRDLYYRLRAHHIHLPPLRTRRGDIALLLHHLVANAAVDLGLPTPAISREVVRTAQSNPWPGNIRELAATIHDAVVRSQGSALDPALFGVSPAIEPAPLTFPERLPTLEEAREQLIAEALRRSHGNLAETSRMLGMTRWGLSKHLRRDASAG